MADDVALRLAMCDLLHFVQCSLDHLLRLVCQQVLRALAAQVTVVGTEPVGHAPAVLVTSEGLDDPGQGLDRTEICFAVQSVAREVINPVVVDGEDLPLLFPFIGLGTGVSRTQSC